MPEKKTLQRARRAKAQGKAPTTQAGEFVREEMEHAKKGKHRVKSRKQAIAIGLSKARRSGVKVPRKSGARKTRATGAGASRRSATGARKTTRGSKSGGSTRRAGAARKTTARSGRSKAKAKA
jgi:hypothetical protein